MVGRKGGESVRQRKWRGDEARDTRKQKPSKMNCGLYTGGEKKQANPWEQYGNAGKETRRERMRPWVQVSRCLDETERERKEVKSRVGERRRSRNQRVRNRSSL